MRHDQIDQERRGAYHARNSYPVCASSKQQQLVRMLSMVQVIEKHCKQRRPKSNPYDNTPDHSLYSRFVG
jgi:hypothetical protein